MDIRIVTRPLTAGLMRGAEWGWVESKAAQIEEKMAECSLFSHTGSVSVDVWGEKESQEDRSRWVDEAKDRGIKSTSEYTDAEVREMFVGDAAASLERLMLDRGFAVRFRPWCHISGEICCDIVVSW